MLKLVLWMLDEKRIRKEDIAQICVWVILSNVVCNVCNYYSFGVCNNKNVTLPVTRQSVDPSYN